LVIAVVLVVGGVTAGVVLLKQDSCSGQSKATVLVVSRIQVTTAKLADDWARTNPNVAAVAPCMRRIV
jgi:hypothetical protein